MVRLLDNKLKVLIAITLIVFIATVAIFSNHLIKQRKPSGADATTASPILTTPSTTTGETTGTTTETTVPETTETTTEETTTVLTTPAPSAHHFSHIIIFLDVQRLVFFHTTEEGVAVPEISLRISSGRVAGTTPITPPDKPFILSGYSASQLLFTKAAHYVWVRYATHVYGDIFIHSQPYDYQKDAQGNALPLDRSLFSKWGYNRLGKYTASNGCIRLSLRDSLFVSQNVHRGMPCYIFASSKGFNLPEAPENPPANLSTRWDPTDMDPMNPYRQREANNMAWKYRPVGQTIQVMVNEQPVAENGIKNRGNLPAGTKYRFKTAPVTSQPGLFDVKVIVTYSDESAEEVSVKINVTDSAVTTTTAEPTTTTVSTTAAPTTTAGPTTTTTPTTTTAAATTSDTTTTTVATTPEDTTAAE